MKLTYDSKYDLLYLKLTDRSPEVLTHRVNDDLAVDLDEDGRIIGIEVLGPAKHIDLASLLPVTVESS